MKKCYSIDKAKVIKIEDFEYEFSEERESDMSMKISKNLFYLHI
ncbi:hypothetical protein Hdeb2414_s0002g00073961 [Helianthus debilis subsp. tardiflorus]